MIPDSCTVRLSPCMPMPGLFCPHSRSLLSIRMPRTVTVSCPHCCGHSSPAPRDPPRSCATQDPHRSCGPSPSSPAGTYTANPLGESAGRTALTALRTRTRIGAPVMLCSKKANTESVEVTSIPRIQIATSSVNSFFAPWIRPEGWVERGRCLPERGRAGGRRGRGREKMREKMREKEREKK